jgi:hypothetical protein
LGVCLLAFCTGVLVTGKFGVNLGTEALRTLAFLVLVFGSQATIYAIRERRHLWGSRPSLLLVVSTVTDIGIASTLAVGGIAMSPLPAVLVAGTLAAAVVFAFALDLVKVPVFARLGIAQSAATEITPSPTKTTGASMTEPTAGEPSAANAKPVTEPDTEPKPKLEVKVQATPESGAGPKLEAKVKSPPDSTPDVVKRVHALYEQLGREDVQAAQDWDKAHADQKSDVNK